MLFFTPTCHKHFGPHCFRRPVSRINQSICYPVSHLVLQHPSVCPYIPRRLQHFSDLSSAACSAGWPSRFSTTDSSASLISPCWQDAATARPSKTRPFLCGRITPTSPCPLSNRCRSIVVQRISGFSAQSLFSSF